MQFISADVFEEVFKVRFPKVDKQDLRDYSEIASFLTNYDKARAAFEELDKTLFELAEKYPKQSFPHEKHLSNLEDVERHKTEAVFGIFPKEENIALDKGKFLRKLSFRKPLQELETKLCGFIDKGRVFTGFVSDKFFAEVLQNLETWKDSIAQDHGEYTHRLQWLAAQIGLNIPMDRIKHLYKNATSHEPTMMRGNSGEEEKSKAFLWDLLVDVFQNNGQFKTQTDMKKLLPVAIVTDSFRSPNHVTLALTQGSMKTPFMTAYMHSSLAKVQIAYVGQKKTPKPENFGDYRRRRVLENNKIDLDKKKYVAYQPSKEGLIARTKEDKDVEILFEDPRC